MDKINMKNLFSALDEEMKFKLSSKIDEIHHPVKKGDESELNWIGLLKTYLPERYSIDTGFVIDCEGNLSDQIDIIIYDRHFTPFIFKGENTFYIPAEGVYAVFEVKQDFTKEHYDYAIKKLQSVQKLKRTSVSFGHIGGESKKELKDIFGGLLTKENKSKKLFDGLINDDELSFVLSLDYSIKFIKKDKVEEQKEKIILAFFLLKLIEKLRPLGSVGALDINEYLKTAI